MAPFSLREQWKGKKCIKGTPLHISSILTTSATSSGWLPPGDKSISFFELFSLDIELRADILSNAFNSMVVNTG